MPLVGGLEVKEQVAFQPVSSPYSETSQGSEPCEKLAQVCPPQASLCHLALHPVE